MQRVLPFLSRLCLLLLLGSAPSLASPFFKGDADGDGAFTLYDVEHVVQIAIGAVQPEEVERFASDFNGDGAVDLLDVVALLDALEDRPLSGQVELPSGSAISVEDLTLLSGLDELTPQPDGQVSIPRPQAPSLAVAVSPDSHAVLLGLSSPYVSRAGLDARSTAEALVYFASYLFAAPPDLFGEIEALLGRTPAVEDLARVLERRLAEDPDALNQQDGEIQAAVEQARPRCRPRWTS